MASAPKPPKYGFSISKCPEKMASLMSSPLTSHAAPKAASKIVPMKRILTPLSVMYSERMACARGQKRSGWYHAEQSSARDSPDIGARLVELAPTYRITRPRDLM